MGKEGRGRRTNCKTTGDWVQVYMDGLDFRDRAIVWCNVCVCICVCIRAHVGFLMVVGKTKELGDLLTEGVELRRGCFVFRDLKVGRYLTGVCVGHERGVELVSLSTSQTGVRAFTTRVSTVTKMF